MIPQGTLVVSLAPGAEVTLKNVNEDNAGWRFCEIAEGMDSTPMPSGIIPSGIMPSSLCNPAFYPPASCPPAYALEHSALSSASYPSACPPIRYADRGSFALQVIRCRSHWQSVATRSRKMVSECSTFRSQEPLPSMIPRTNVLFLEASGTRDASVPYIQWDFNRAAKHA